MRSLGLVVETDESDETNEVSVLPELPSYSQEIDYYKEYFRMYLQNENLVADID
jgi:hypothetical protein